MRLKPWQLGAVLAALCGIIIGVLQWRSTMGSRSPQRLLEALPPGGSLTGFLDVGKLRASGVLEDLAGSKALEDPEYRAFAQQIGFDYRTDLDGIAASYAHDGIYAALRGRFNYLKLSAYAIAQKGQCTDGICSMPASRPHQTISFELLSSDVLAWSVSEQTLGVEQIGFAKSKLDKPASAEDVLWVSAPGSSYRDPENVPSGTRAFLSPLSAAQSASFALQPANSGAAAKFEIRLDAVCASPQVATQLADVLTQTTEVLRGMIVKDQVAADSSSLTGVLVSGRFEAHAASVVGSWPIGQQFLRNLFSGEIR